MDKQSELETRWTSLETERASWITQWREISEYLLPKNGRFFLQDRNRGNKGVWNKIIDSTATGALRTLAAGLMSGASSPARPWFRLQTHNEALNAYQPVKIWLDQVAQLMLAAFAKSNTYQGLQQIYEELGGFGTGAAIIMPDFNNVLHCYPLTAGEYCIATDAKGDVCTLFRRFQMTVSQLVKEFGLENCSSAVQAVYRTGTGLDQWRTVQWSIEPRADRDPSKKDAKNMAWGSWYFEVGTKEGKFLSESGFKQFPGIAPRWTVSGGDIYGTSPGMEALGDVKQLQHQQMRKGQAIDYQTKPPLQVPVGMKGQEVGILPGEITYFDPNTQGTGVKTMWDVKLEMQYLMQDIEAVQNRIEKKFFVDLFLMLSSSTDPRMTATEVSARQEEKMLVLGPVLSRLSKELFQPLITLTFTYMLEAGALPPPPQELQGQQLTVELVSILAQAQQAVGVNSIDRFLASLLQLAQIKPEALDMFDSDAYVTIIADRLGVDPRLVLANDKVQALRAARAKAQAAQQQAAMMEQNSKTAKNLGQTPTSGPANAGMDMMQQFQGYGTGVPQ